MILLAIVIADVAGLSGRACSFQSNLSDGFNYALDNSTVPASCFPDFRTTCYRQTGSNDSCNLLIWPYGTYWNTFSNFVLRSDTLTARYKLISDLNCSQFQFPVFVPMEYLNEHLAARTCLDLETILNCDSNINMTFYSVFHLWQTFPSTEFLFPLPGSLTGDKAQIISLILTTDPLTLPLATLSVCGNLDTPDYILGLFDSEISEHAECIVCVLFNPKEHARTTNGAACKLYILYSCNSLNMTDFYISMSSKLLSECNDICTHECYLISCRDKIINISRPINCNIFYELDKHDYVYSENDKVADCLLSHLASGQPILNVPTYSDIVLKLILRVLLAIVQQLLIVTQFLEAVFNSSCDTFIDIMNLCEILSAHFSADILVILTKLSNFLDTLATDISQSSKKILEAMLVRIEVMLSCFTQDDAALNSDTGGQRSVAQRSRPAPSETTLSLTRLRSALFLVSYLLTETVSPARVDATDLVTATSHSAQLKPLHSAAPISWYHDHNTHTPPPAHGWSPLSELWFPVSVLVLLFLGLAVGVTSCYILLLILRELKTRPDTVVTHNHTYQYPPSYRSQSSSLDDTMNTLNLTPGLDDPTGCIRPANYQPAPTPSPKRMGFHSYDVLNCWKFADFFPAIENEVTVMTVLASEDCQDEAKQETKPVPESNLESSAPDQHEQNLIKTDTITEDSDSSLSDESSSQYPYLSFMPKSKGDKANSQLTMNRTATPKEKLSKRINRAKWSQKSQNDESSGAGDVSSSGSSVSGDLTRRSRQPKWITKDGEYSLDRSQSCKLGLINEHLDLNGSISMMRELSNTIQSTCSPNNSDNFRIDCSYNTTTKLEEAAPGVGSDTNRRKKKKNPEKKKSALELNLNDDSTELAALIKNYQKRISSVCNRVFRLDVEFDQTTIHKLSDATHSIPYENSANVDNNSFSPIVSILTLGPQSVRPLLMKTVTKAGGTVTHKIALSSGSLCVLSGRTETGYKRSIPKGFGTEEEQYFLVFTQKTPQPNISKELSSIEMPSPSQSLGNEELSPNLACGHNDQSPDKLDRSTASTAHTDRESNVVPIELPASDCKATNQVMKTPPTVIRFPGSKPEDDDIRFQFQDAPDSEPCSGLILAENLGPAIELMDPETVKAELMRNHLPTTGDEGQNRKRLFNKICMSIGELSFSANNSINAGILRIQSPEAKKDVESLTNSQKCIENTLVEVVNSIISLKSEIGQMKSSSTCPAENAQPSEHGADAEPSQLKVLSRRISELKQEIYECTQQLISLGRGIEEFKEDFHDTREEISNLKEDAVRLMRETSRDIGTYYHSVFADESREQIKAIHQFVTTELDDAGIPVTESSNREVTNSQQEAAVVPNTETVEVVQDIINPPATTPDQETQQVPEAATFTFPEQINISLKTAIQAGKPINVLLITDSLMRHIEDEDLKFRKYNIHFQRIDKRKTSQLRDHELLHLIRQQQPHLIYVHLGINDIHHGERKEETMDNITNFDNFLRQASPSTKLILSQPLLNGNNFHTRQIMDLRQALLLYRNKHEQSRDVNTKRLFLRDNEQFFTDRSAGVQSQKRVYFQSSDSVHLSHLGRKAMICNMRDLLHSIFKDLQLTSSC